VSDAPAPVTIGKATLYLGDCLARLRELADASVDAVVTDPPYGLTFMGRHWDYDVPTVEIWAECLRVLKPGGHLLAFAGTRTQHRMAVRIEDAGFEIRDMIAWVYGSGFPKSLDVSKAIDKAAGVERDEYPDPRWLDRYPNGNGGNHNRGEGGIYGKAESVLGRPLTTSAPATDAARQWAGWGTALKPALEPVTVARKPLIGTVADNVLTHGTGGLNVDGCRVGTDDNLNGGRYSDNKQGDDGNSYGSGINERSANDYQQPIGRWPANLIHDGAEYFGDQSRFFYTAKASKSDRDEGLDGFALQKNDFHRASSGLNQDRPGREGRKPSDGARNHHPTVKPTDLMRYLCRLVTPPGGTVLDPFMGSGSTGKGAVLEGFRFIGIEREADYFDIARTRIDRVQRQATIFDLLEAAEAS
jgi:site-specific DNA-methyltransferase (adenine-specific)